MTFECSDVTDLFVFLPIHVTPDIVKLMCAVRYDSWLSLDSLTETDLKPGLFMWPGGI